MAHYSMPYLPKADWQPLEKLAQRVLKTALTRAYNDFSSNDRNDQDQTRHVRHHGKVHPAGDR
jgi:hypothetical protein